MLAFITGASSGIGREMAIQLGKKGFDLIITGRDSKKLEEVKKTLQEKTNVEVIVADLSKEDEVFKLYEQIKNREIDVFINNAGLGVAGEFWKTDLNTEIEMIKVNDLAMHILFKLILRDMIESRNNDSKKYILNVSSLSGFMPRT